MKYYVEFPISFNCNLQCDYCFHNEYHTMLKAGTASEKYRETRKFSLAQYQAWRDKHLKDGTEFLMELSGGEVSHPKNQEDVLNIITTFNKERFQIQTNGLGDPEFYKKLFALKHKIDRVGFTFHRKMIADKPELVQKYEENVMLCNSFGIKTYVKELLISEYRDKILENRNYWKSKGIEFRVQDFKGFDKGTTYDEYKNYSNVDKLLVYPEYRHYGDECACRIGYKNIHITGFSMWDGCVYSCWQNQCIVGHILEDWYNGNYKVCRTPNGIEITGVPKKYNGTYPTGVYKPGYDKIYAQLTFRDLEK